MEIQALNEMVIAGLSVAAAPIIMYVVDIMKIVFKMKNVYAPYMAAAVGIVLGVALSVEVGGASTLNIMIGIAAGINVGFAAVGIHNTSRRKKRDESGAAEID